MAKPEPCPLNDQKAQLTPKNAEEALCFALHDELKKCRAFAHLGPEQFSKGLAVVETFIRQYRHSEALWKKRAAENEPAPLCYKTERTETPPDKYCKCPPGYACPLCISRLLPELPKPTKPETANQKGLRMAKHRRKFRQSAGLPDEDSAPLTLEGLKDLIQQEKEKCNTVYATPRIGTAVSPITFAGFSYLAGTRFIVVGKMYSGSPCCIMPDGERAGHSFTATAEEIAVDPESAWNGELPL